MFSSSESLETVFNFEGLHVMGENAHVQLLGQLKSLELYWLPNLEHLCRQIPQGIHAFQNLQKLEVNNCHNLGYLISSTMAHMLVNLESLSVSWCKSMKEVVEMNEDCALKKIVFHSLSRVELRDIEELSSFCSSEQQSFEFPSLGEVRIDVLCLGNLIKVKIDKCPAIECLFPHSAAKCLVQLQVLRVNSCERLEEIFSKGESGTTSTSTGAEIRKEPHNDFKVLFPKLRKLILRNLPQCGGFYNLKLDDGTVEQPLLNPLVLLPSLKVLNCYHMHQLKQIVGGGMLELSKLVASDWLQNLEGVDIGYSDSLETVFKFEGLCVMGENAYVQLLGQLKSIELRVLPNLEHLCRQIPQGIHTFQNLQNLEVYDCTNLGYLISSTMAHMLVNLESLSVSWCKSMKEVVEMNEDCALKKIVFRSLRRVTLTLCGELSSFCSSEQQSFEFPSLEEVYINNCPKIKTFCCGHLTAEKLDGVKPTHPIFGDNRLIWKGDLNETVRQLNARNRVNQMNSDLEEDDVPEEGITDEYAECTNEDDIGSSSSIPLEQGTQMKASMPLSVVSSPNVSLTPVVVSPSPPVSDNNEKLANSSSPDLRKDALPSLIEFTPSASMDQSVHSSDSPVQPKADKELSDMSSLNRDDDWKRSRILIQGVYVKVELKTTFEEVLTAKPNFLSGFRLKTVGMKTEAVESTILSLQILRQRTALTISSEELAFIRDSLNDLESSGLDTAWLERGYQRAMLVIKEQKVISAAADLAMLERKNTEDEAAFEMAREKLEASTARRDAFKADYGALMQELEVGKELFGDGFDLETSLGDGLLD